MFKSLLVPIDLAQPSSWELSLPQAIELATASGGTVRVMTVVRDLKSTFEGANFPFQFELMMSDARGKLIAVISAHRRDSVTVVEDIRCGSVGREILQAARRHHTDLIVMASHRPEMKDYLIGPNAAYVAQHALCSVLVLRPPERAAA